MAYAYIRSNHGSAKLWLPNARLAVEPLPNVSRSEKRWEGFKVLFRFSSINTKASNVPLSARKASSCGYLMRGWRRSRCPTSAARRSAGRASRCVLWMNVVCIHLLQSRKRKAVAAQCAACSGAAAQCQPLGEALGGLQGVSSYQ